MSEQDSNKALVKRSCNAVAVPSGGQSGARRPTRKALEEEEFTDALTTIIRRDFFPDVAKLEAQLDFIDASQNNDYNKLRELSERFATTSHTPAPPSATPATFETPAPSVQNPGTTPLTRAGLKHAQMSTDEVPGPSDTKKLKADDSTGLDTFLAKYHSEDDASFGELVEKAEEEHKLKHAWLYEKELEYTPAIGAPDEPLAITSGSDDNGKTKAIEYRPAGVKSWKYTAKNSLMYIPEGMEQSAKDQVIKATEKREVVHSNTRLSRNFLKQSHEQVTSMTGGEDATSKGKINSNKIGVDGKILGITDSPKVGGYGFVATPQIHPGVDASPLMTWGSIDGTPFRLETDVVPQSGPAFKMPKECPREKLAHKLAEKNTKAYKERKKAAAYAASPALLRQKLGATPTSSERLQLLSPAARKLVTRAATPGSIGGRDKALQTSYSTPVRSPLMSPRSTPGHSKMAAGASTPSLTDDLLKLKNR